MTEKVLDRLRVFHARCVRAMSRVSRKHTWSEHIQTQQLEQELGLETIDLHVKRRQLRWLGHVRRMGFERLPRRMLSSWVNAPRPRGAPQMTYGRSITKALEMFNIDVRTWPELAADRAAWRETLRAGRPPPGFAPPPPPPRRLSRLIRPRRAPAPPPSRPRRASMSTYSSSPNSARRRGRGRGCGCRRRRRSRSHSRSRGSHRCAAASACSRRERRGDPISPTSRGSRSPCSSLPSTLRTHRRSHVQIDHHDHPWPQRGCENPSEYADCHHHIWPAPADPIGRPRAAPAREHARVPTYAL